MSSSDGLALVSLAISVIVLVYSSLTLSAQALSLQPHILSLYSPIFAIASFFFLQPNEAIDMAARNAIVKFFICIVLCVCLYFFSAIGRPITSPIDFSSFCFCAGVSFASHAFAAAGSFASSRHASTSVDHASSVHS